MTPDYRALCAELLDELLDVPFAAHRRCRILHPEQ